MSSILKLVKIRLHRHLIDPIHDWRLGITTSGVHPPGELALRGSNAPHAVEYRGTPSWVLARALDALAIDTRRFAFVDFSSGKGRVLLHAAKRPFLPVEGIELSEPLNRIALRNIANANAAGMLRSPVYVHQMDVMQYTLPRHPLVLYLFNPFGEVVIRQVLDKLEASLRRNPRECYLIYLNPKHQTCFDQRPFLRQMPRSKWADALDRLISPWPLATYRFASRTARVGVGAGPLTADSLPLVTGA